MAVLFASSCSQADVQAAADAASPLSIIMVPAGTATWGASESYIAVSKKLKFVGAGAGNTVITISPTAGRYANTTVRCSAAAWFTGFSFVQTGDDDTSLFSFTANGWRVSNCHYDDGYTSGAWNAGYFIYATAYGLLDHCTLDVAYGQNEYLFTRGPTDSWQTASGYGTTNMVVMEDCTVTGSGYTDFNSNARA